VQATVKIVLKDEVPIKRALSQLIRPSGQQCDARRECLDLENVQTFWPMVVQDKYQLSIDMTLYTKAWQLN